MEKTKEVLTLKQLNLVYLILFLRYSSKMKCWWYLNRILLINSTWLNNWIWPKYLRGPGIEYLTDTDTVQLIIKNKFLITRVKIIFDCWWQKEWPQGNNIQRLALAKTIPSIQLSRYRVFQKNAHFGFANFSASKTS